MTPRRRGCQAPARDRMFIFAPRPRAARSTATRTSSSVVPWAAAACSAAGRSPAMTACRMTPSVWHAAPMARVASFWLRGVSPFAKPKRPTLHTGARSTRQAPVAIRWPGRMSAQGGVTDRLFALARTALAGRSGQGAALEQVEELHHHHARALGALCEGASTEDAAADAAERLDACFAELRDIVIGVSLLGELS